MVKSILAPLIVLSVVGLFGALFYLAYRHWQQRIAAIQSLGAQLKLRYFQKGDPSLFPLLDNLEFFQRGETVGITHLLMGQINRRQQPVTVAIFDYQYRLCRYRDEVSIDQGIQISSSTDASYFSHTVLVFHDPRLDLPSFTLRSENIIDKIGSMMGWQDINFPQFSRFSKKYVLQSDAEFQVRSLFQANLIQFCEQAHLCLEARGSYLLAFPIYQGNHKKISFQNGINASQSCILDAAEIKPCLDRGLQLLTLLETNQALVES
jgi:hypothetical protein